jgi:HEAT repeat protein
MMNAQLGCEQHLPRSTNQQAGRPLMGIGENWSEWLKSESAEDQVVALRQIAGAETVTGFTVAVVQLSGSRNDEVRMWSAEAMETTVQPNVGEVSALGELLENAVDGEICYWAATMLGRLGCQSVGAVSALEGCVGESMYLPAREQATWALSQIGPRASSAIPTLREAAEDAPPRLQRMASDALRAIGEAA